MYATNDTWILIGKIILIILVIAALSVGIGLSIPKGSDGDGGGGGGGGGGSKQWPTPGPKPQTPQPTIPAPEPNKPPIRCGEGTISEGGQCVFDRTKVINSKKLQSFLVGSVLPVSGTPTFLGPDAVAPMPDHTAPWEPNWAQTRTQSLGRKVGCSCGDCAPWRGGTQTNCSLTKIGDESDTKRVRCVADYTVEASSYCVCANGYTPVGGLCVTPYQSGCPKCVLDGTCAGREVCDQKDLLRERYVEYPGDRYECEGKTGELSFGTTQELSASCKKANDSNGKNEYLCALECTNSVGNPEYCSKVCLPKLWKWENILVAGKVVGSYQPGDLVENLPSDYSLSTCAPYVVSSNTLPDGICKECTGCKWEKTGDKWAYSCASCGRCNETVGDVGYCKGSSCNGCDLNGRCSSCKVVDGCNTYSRNKKDGCNMVTYNRGSGYDS